MALTNWNDILNKPKGIDDIEEIALEVSELSSSVLTISGDVEKNTEAINTINEKKYYLAGSINVSSEVGNITLSKSIENADKILYVLSESLAFRYAQEYPIQFIKGGRTGIDFSIYNGSREYAFFDYVNGTTLNLSGQSLGANATLYIYAYGKEPIIQAKKTTKKK